MSNDDLDSVRVVVRFRPVNSREKAEKKDEIVIDIEENTAVRVRDPEKRNRVFQFDYVFGMDSAQEDVFNQTGALLVDKVLKGINCTLFAFGQTGSGKTFTMEGVIGNSDNEGLIPRMVRRLFDVILSNQKEEPDVQFTLGVSYVEIYNERLRDLLNPENAPVLRGGDKRVHISKVEKRWVNQPSDVFSLLHSGHVNRSVSKTLMNAASSRSHAVFLLYVTREEAGGSKKTSKLLMVDLAGSEKVKKTCASGDTLEEAKNINKSLSTLGNVINALTKGQQHIPYRDSILTRLLSDALGGNSKTCLIIACSPAIFNREETLSTLRFGKRAKEIKNTVAVNEELSVKEYKARIAAAKAKICQLNAIVKQQKLKISKMIEAAANCSDKSLNLASIVEQVEADHPVDQIAMGESQTQKTTKKKVRFKFGHARSATTLDLKKTKKTHKSNRSVDRTKSVDSGQLGHGETEPEQESDFFQSVSPPPDMANIESNLALEASVMQLKRDLLEKRLDLERAEGAERRLNDELTVQREGHLELRQDFEKIRNEVQSLYLQKTHFENKCNEDKLLMQSMKLQHKDAEIEFNTKHDLYKNKIRNQADKISKLKAELKETQRLLKMERNLAQIRDGAGEHRQRRPSLHGEMSYDGVDGYMTMTPSDERDYENSFVPPPLILKPSTPKKQAKTKYSNLDYSNSNNRNNKNNINLEIILTNDSMLDVKPHEWDVIKSKKQKAQIKQAIASARKINEDCRLLKDRTKKLNAHLYLYKERDVTNNLLRQIWLKNLKQLEQSLCEQFAINERQQLEWKYKQIQFEDEVNRLRQIIQSFREYESHQQQQQFKSVISPNTVVNHTGKAFNYPRDPRAMSVPPSSTSTSPASIKHRGGHVPSRSRDCSIGNPDYTLYEASQRYKSPSPYMDEMKTVNRNVNVDRRISGNYLPQPNPYNYGNYRVGGSQIRTPVQSARHRMQSAGLSELNL